MNTRKNERSRLINTQPFQALPGQIHANLAAAQAVEETAANTQEAGGHFSRASHRLNKFYEDYFVNSVFGFFSTCCGKGKLPSEEQLINEVIEEANRLSS